MMSLSLKLAVFASALGSGVAVPGSQSLKGAITPPDSKDSLIVDHAIQSMFSNFEVHQPGQAQVAAAAKNDGKGVDAQGKQPVGIQVDEKVMNEMTKSLSEKCSERYTAMINGKGPEMHTFDEHGAAPGEKKTKSEQCAKELKGSECSTRALITEAKDVPDGRTMTSKIKVVGVSCLPKECTSQEDLSILSTFMHRQTKEVMPGEAIKVNLHVDCSESGGGVVDVEADGTAPAAREKANRSGAAALLGFGPLAAILLWVVA